MESHDEMNATMTRENIAPIVDSITSSAPPTQHERADRRPITFLTAEA